MSINLNDVMENMNQLARMQNRFLVDEQRFVSGSILEIIPSESSFKRLSALKALIIRKQNMRMMRK